MHRASLTFRLVEAADARLRRHGSPALQRRAYRLGYLALRPWWFITRPRIRGTKAVVRRGDEVLLVKHAYARRAHWDLPGGFVRAGEEPEVAVRRELAEELGVTPLRLRCLGSVPMRNDHKREVVHTYAADVDSAAVAPDAAELAEVRWVMHGALPDGTTPFARRLVARAYWELWDAEEH
ncbi:MAG: NUDIX hydrolase [Solirubrobacterales bacterium]|nr:NUDIX hydrolase [Solirubrobacterales bacterium]